jgi:hypothetical protein
VRDPAPAELGGELPGGQCRFEADREQLGLVRVTGDRTESGRLETHVAQEDGAAGEPRELVVGHRMGNSNTPARTVNSLRGSPTRTLTWSIRLAMLSYALTVGI